MQVQAFVRIGDTSSQLEIRREPTVIGRGSFNIPLTEKSISSRHVSIRVKCDSSDELIIRPLGLNSCFKLEMPYVPHSHKAEKLTKDTDYVLSSSNPWILILYRDSKNRDQFPVFPTFVFPPQSHESLPLDGDFAASALSRHCDVSIGLGELATAVVSKRKRAPPDLDGFAPVTFFSPDVLLPGLSSLLPETNFSVPPPKGTRKGIKEKLRAPAASASSVGSKRAGRAHKLPPPSKLVASAQPLDADATFADAMHPDMPPPRKRKASASPARKPSTASRASRMETPRVTESDNRHGLDDRSLLLYGHRIRQIKRPVPAIESAPEVIQKRSDVAEIVEPSESIPSCECENHNRFRADLLKRAKERRLKRQSDKKLKRVLEGLEL